MSVNITKKLFLIMVALTIAICLAGCANSSKSGSSDADLSNAGSAEYDQSSNLTEEQAINLVITDFRTEREIAKKLGFKSYSSPQYGTTSAKKDSFDTWKVTLKGNMSGYVDDYRSDFDRKNFTVSASIWDNKVSSVSVSAG